MKIYALKTAPAFEAALYSGVRLAGPVDKYDKMIVDFSRHMGVAFQIMAHAGQLPYLEERGGQCRSVVRRVRVRTIIASAAIRSGKREGQNSSR